MTRLYPRERVEAVLRPLSGMVVHRILFKGFLKNPLAIQAVPSRFCDGRSYAVLYAAADFVTSFAEAVVRDRFVQRDRRVIEYNELWDRAWVEFAVTADEPLRMLDLREDGCLTLGAPTDAAHARNHSAGHALSRAIYQQHVDVDGIWYRSRLTGGECFAIFDRATARLTVNRTGELEHHPNLPGVLRARDIALETL